jgi:peptidase M23-like protein
MTDAKVLGYRLAAFLARLLLVVCCPISATCVNAQPLIGAPASSPRLEIRVPFQPTAFPSAGRTHLFYELHIRNTGTAPVTLRRIEAFDAAGATSESIAAVEADQLNGILQPIAGQTPTDSGSDRRRLAPGVTVIAFMSLALGRGVHVPGKLLHRVATGDFTAEGTAIETHHTKLRVLGPPLAGAAWLAADAPSNDEDNHHRRGILIVNGRPVISRRYAIDWKQIEDGTSFSGDAGDNHSYFAYGKAVLAVAHGRVVTATDDLPDNVPRHNGIFQPAVPITLDTAGGNTVTLAIGDGQFVYYCHLQPGSLRVKVGDRVRRGEVLARVGDSGDAREPHLHLEVTTDSHFVAGEGVPYLINKYRVISENDGTTGLRTRELPLNNDIVDFGKGGGN